jgi:hypothetical protein
MLFVKSFCLIAEAILAKEAQLVSPLSLKNVETADSQQVDVFCLSRILQSGTFWLTSR